MKKSATIMITLIMVLFANHAFSQVNLVPNPSFETNHGVWVCPYNSSDSLLWPNYWVSPAPIGDGDPDYFLTWYCDQYSSVPSNRAGFQFPFEGNAYTAICVASEILGVPYREYLQTALIDTLEAGHSYCFSAWVSCSDSAGKATDDIGVYFSDTAIYKYDGKNFQFTPQIRNPEGRYLEDKGNWQLFSGTFIASGSERFITIGNFLNDSSTTYTIPEPHSNDVVWLGSGGYYLDMVSLYDCTDFDYRADAGGKNVHIRLGDSVQLGTDDNPARQYSWSPAATLSANTVGRPTAAPQQTTTYTLTVIDEYFQMTSDSITVFVDPELAVGIDQTSAIKLYPNSANGKLIVVLPGKPLGSSVILEMYDAGGMLVNKQKFNNQGTNSLSTGKLASGVYWCSLISDKVKFYGQKIVLLK